MVCSLNLAALFSNTPVQCGHPQRPAWKKSTAEARPPAAGLHSGLAPGSPREWVQHLVCRDNSRTPNSPTAYASQVRRAANLRGQQKLPRLLRQLSSRSYIC